MALQFECYSFPELSLDQLYAALALRQEAFVVEQHCPYLDADGNDQKALHVLGWDDQGRLAAYSRILPVGVSYDGYAAIGRVVTAAFARGQGYGRLLMKQAIAELEKAYGQVPIKLSAQAHLQDYYESVGFQRVGEAYLEDGIPHVAMESCRR